MLPDDPLLGRTHYTVGLIEGGVAPNVVSPHASAELSFRTVGNGAAVREAMHVVESLVSLEYVLDIPAVFAGLFTVILIGLVVENLIFRNVEAVTVRRWGMQS